MNLAVAKNTLRQLGTSRKVIVSAIALSLSGSALAIEFEMDNGWKGSLNTTVSASASWRVEAPDPRLLSTGAAAAIGINNGTAGNSKAKVIGMNGTTPIFGPTPGLGSSTDTADMNYDKGDRYSTLLKVVSELSLRKGDTGGMIRVKGWYDQALNDESVRWGHSNNGFAANSPLSDKGFDKLNKFDGLYLLDAYGYTSFDVGGSDIQVRLGRQAVNWGESIFIQGVNQLSPLDVAALRKGVGTELKEALLPVWAAYANLSLGGGMSVEGFYQFKFQPMNLESCGTNWAVTETKIGTDTGTCDRGIFSPTGANGNTNSRTAYKAGGYYTQQDAPTDPKDSGQWGLAMRFPVESIDTEFGLYYMNLTSRLPVISVTTGTNLGAWAKLNKNALTALAGGAGGAGGVQAAAAINGAVGQAIIAGPAVVGSTIRALQAAAPGLGLSNYTDSSSYWEFPSNVKTMGLSATTTMVGWSVAAELSYQQDVPVQKNGVDLFAALQLGLGPVTGAQTAGQILAYLGGRAADPATGKKIQGYDLFDKWQLQVNAVNTLPAVLGATSGLFVGEVAVQTNNVPDYKDGAVRYGRGFMFGSGAAPSFNAMSGLPIPALAALGNSSATGCFAGLNVNADGCHNDGFVTDFAWGYRMKVSLDYSGVFGSSWNATPSIFWGHDVKGVSMDSQFNEGRKALGLGLRMSLNKEHVIDMSYTTFANSAKWDNFRDRDNVGIAYSYTF